MNRPEPDDPADLQPANVDLINIDPPTEEECQSAIKSLNLLEQMGSMQNRLLKAGVNTASTVLTKPLRSVWEDTVHDDWCKTKPVTIGDR